MVLNQDSVVQDSEGTRLDSTTGRGFGWMKNNVVGLPLAGLAARIHERGSVPVKCGGLAVRIGAVLITVQDLDLVASHEVNPTVPTALAFAFNLRRCGPLHVQLHGPKFLSSENVARVVDLGVSVLHALASGCALSISPLRQVFAVKKHDGVGRRSSLRSGINHRGFSLGGPQRQRGKGAQTPNPDEPPDQEVSVLLHNYLLL